MRENYITENKRNSCMITVMYMNDRGSRITHFCFIVDFSYYY